MWQVPSAPERMVPMPAIHEPSDLLIDGASQLKVVTERIFFIHGAHCVTCHNEWRLHDRRHI
ncbi:hypothetical protein GCM10009835_20900 [Planosporangium flavigriseum]|uniref:Uncharacterized protein n=1 Tax=Planosporangium flavigriseum TaxID=373681 RepID=A0A8J3LK31_9ACTN|nr:hypothetical protein Pfl04_05220 [Planosporangium flavigriseum]